MPDLAERIREFVEAAQPTVTMDQVTEVLARQQRESPSVRSTGRRRPLIAITLVAASVVAVVATIIAVGANPDAAQHTRSADSGSPAAKVLKHAALVADTQPSLVPGPGQFLYVRLLDGSQEAALFPPTGVGHPLARYYVQETLEQWTSQTGPNHQTWTVVGQPEFITGNDRELWEQAGSPLIESGYGNGGTPPYYDVTDLPTDPSRMAAFFASQTELQTQTLTGKPNNLWDFTTAASFLENGASAQQRAALLRYMATIPGVADDGPGTTLGTKLTGTILAMPSTKPGLTVEVVIDEGTSEVLEIRTVVSDASLLGSPPAEQIAGGRAVAPLKEGQAQQYQDFLYDGIAESSNAVPSGSPIPPPTWPYGSGREPQAGTAY
jgi:hypothetical protein